MKALRGWAIERDGKLMLGTLASARSDAVTMLPGLFPGCDFEPYEGWSEWWRRVRRLGYRAVRVEARPVRPGRGATGTTGGKKR